jgi:hypothetical protein
MIKLQRFIPLLVAVALVQCDSCDTVTKTIDTFTQGEDPFDPYDTTTMQEMDLEFTASAASYDCIFTYQDSGDFAATLELQAIDIEVTSASSEPVPYGMTIDYDGGYSGWSPGWMPTSNPGELAPWTTHFDVYEGAGLPELSGGGTWTISFDHGPVPDPCLDTESIEVTLTPQ